MLLVASETHDLNSDAHALDEARSARDGDDFIFRLPAGRSWVEAVRGGGRFGDDACAGSGARAAGMAVLETNYLSTQTIDIVSEKVEFKP